MQTWAKVKERGCRLEDLWKWKRRGEAARVKGEGGEVSCYKHPK